MPNYFSELLLKPSNTIVKVKDENAQNSITNLTANLQTEITNRSNADTQLQSNIDNEVLARENADNLLLPKDNPTFNTALIEWELMEKESSKEGLSSLQIIAKMTAIIVVSAEVMGVQNVIV